MKGALVCLLFGVFTCAANANESIWEREGARVSGSGCRHPDDVLFVTYGTEADVSFSDFSVVLDGGADAGSWDRTSRADCRVDIPMVVPGGSFVDELHERVDVGIVKTEGSTGGLESRARFHGWVLKNLSLLFDRGERMEMLSEELRGTRFDGARVFCGRTPGNGIRGFFSNDISLWGKREASFESFRLAALGQNLHWHLSAALRPCR